MLSNLQILMSIVGYSVYLYCIFLAGRMKKSNIKPINDILKSKQFNIINVGSTIDAECIFEIIKIFYYQDNKFAISCPVFNGKKVKFPIVFNVKDDNSISLSNDILTDDLKKEAASIFDSYLEDNKQKFI